MITGPEVKTTYTKKDHVQMPIRPIVLPEDHQGLEQLTNNSFTGQHS